MRRFDGAALVVATHNRGKLEEIAALLAPFGVAVTICMPGEIGIYDEVRARLVPPVLARP